MCHSEAHVCTENTISEIFVRVSQANAMARRVIDENLSKPRVGGCNLATQVA